MASSVTSMDFWSKIGQHRGTNLVSPATEKPAESSESTPAKVTGVKKAGTVSKAQKESGVRSPAHTTMSFSSTLTSPMTAISWADSMEEDEALFAAAVTSCDDDRNGVADSLTKDLVVQHSQRIEEFEATVAQQKGRIAELDADVKDKEIEIERLQNTVQDKEERVAELEAHTQKQELRIMDLISEVKEEARRAQELDEKLQKNTTRLRELELQVAENVDMPDSNTPTEVDDYVEIESVKEATQPALEDVSKPATPEALGATDGSKDTAAGAEDIAAEAVPETSAKIEAVSPSTDQFPALSPVDFPALGSPPQGCDATRSIFITAENIKKVPPPPPAKKLTLGIDPSKFKKKTQPAPVSGRKLMFGVRRVDEAPPAINPAMDVRRMSKEEREPFGYGPTVQIVVGNQAVATLPKYMFMQVSPKAFKYWTENPNATSIKFQKGAFTIGALEIQMEWITMHTYCNKVFSVTLKQGNGDRHNFELIRCARALGLHSMYMGHFTRLYCQQCRDGPSPELVDLIEELSWDETDPIFECLANNMALQHSKAKPGDLEGWSQHLSRHPRLAKKMGEIQARKNFAMGKTSGKGKGQSPPPSTAAEQAVAEEVTAPTATPDTDPDAGWRATTPAYV
ncbi:hypothetical protein BU23DRAFT_602331 [Bimuria novae-zelandiae CBS 107.79]|uniref:Uncharacterized protein n=1 Tax=Bimuria novae-zelandiae CBS 107.79 TaxID=1447943 RepID=A0A6A5UTZ0_9PLEO|nr:hypothetical protein BU23DRAFT_602331 [Bimuria novae-zelandiae CBS 107.79]